MCECVRVRESVCVCERESVCVSERVSVGDKETTRGASVYSRERARDRVCERR